MHASRGQTQHHVAGLDVLASQNFGLFHGADSKTCQVVFASGVHAGHLSGLTTDQCAARQLAALGNTAHYSCSGIYIQLAAGKVVKEEQWLGALHQHVVDAHGNQVDAHGVVHIPFKRQTQLGAHTIGAGDQNGFFVALGHFKQRAETANACHHAFTHGFFGQGLDALNQCVARVDVNASVFVRNGGRLGGRGAHGMDLCRNGARAGAGEGQILSRYPMACPSCRSVAAGHRGL